MTDPHKHSRAGWRAEEDAALFALAAEAQRDSRPLRSVFEETARRFGRRPNSVRNYYYARVRGDSSGRLAHSPAFVPFTGEETRWLLSEVLAAKARGESVRACTLRLGKGDTRAMLRYQNKYRAVLRGNPALVAETLDALRAEGVAAQDPYAPAAGAPRAGRPRKKQDVLTDCAARVAEELAQVEGLDVHALFDSLGALAVSAVSGAKSRAPAPAAAELERLRTRVKTGDEQLAAERARFTALLGYFRQLVRVNAAFLSASEAGNAPGLAACMRDLQTSVEDCERLIVEYR